jgi:hypothetical protein
MAVESRDAAKWNFIFRKILIENLFILFTLVNFLFIKLCYILKLSTVNVDN